MRSDEETIGWLSVTDAANTYNPALVVLRAKGYRLYFVPDERPEFFGDYWAIKGGRVFSAADPLRLLGLVALWEHDGDEWQRKEREWILTEVEEIGFAEDNFLHLDDHAFGHLVQTLRPLFAFFGKDLPDGVTRDELATHMHALSHIEGEETQQSRG